MKETSEYVKQADAFLEKNGLKMRATFKGDKCPKWSKCAEPSRIMAACPKCGSIHGDRFRVTLWRDGKSGRVSFDFWDSYHNHANRVKELTAYDVLACISIDVNTPETFGGFCSAYGYEEDSRKAFQTFKACDSLARRLRGLFTEGEIEELSEIQ